MNNIKNYVQENKERFLNELIELLKIPSVSADSAYAHDVIATANAVKESLEKAGCNLVEICETPGYPIVYGEHIIDKNLPTVLVYGHYDVQPPDPIELWTSPPFEPVIKTTEIHPEGAIFARGACDDKGQMYMHVKAFEYMIASNNLPCNVKFMIEGEEEVGSKSLSWFVERNQEKLANDFEQSVKAIVNIVASAATELSQTAHDMVSMINGSSQKAGDATSAATLTTANVQTVAAAAEELSASVREISGQFQKTTQLVVRSGEKANNADFLANALTKSSDKVSQAMEMISTIAGQINLLALNATIESARAGEAGKGFAVVASEVKNLAGQTDRSVVEIQSVVAEMRTASQAIIAALNEIKSSVNAISEATSSVASAVEEQSATTNEIARSMQTAAEGTQTISSNLQDVSKSSTQAGAAAEQMFQASQELSKQAESLNSHVDAFLVKIRAS